MNKPLRIVESDQALDALDLMDALLAANCCVCCTNTAGEPLHLKAIGNNQVKCPRCTFQISMVPPEVIA